MTAVEYLEKIINDCRKYQHQYQKDIDKAKEMERQQIEDAYIQGFCECDATGIMDTEKYYNETYKPTP